MRQAFLLILFELIRVTFWVDFFRTLLLDFFELTSSGFKTFWVADFLKYLVWFFGCSSSLFSNYLVRFLPNFLFRKLWTFWEKIFWTLGRFFFWIFGGKRFIKLEKFSNFFGRIFFELSDSNFFRSFWVELCPYFLGRFFLQNEMK